MRSWVLGNHQGLETSGMPVSGTREQWKLRFNYSQELRKWGAHPQPRQKLLGGVSSGMERAE